MSKNYDREKLAGLWRSRGYGWLWSITKKKIKAYDEGDGYCVKTPYSEDHLSELGERIKFSNNDQTIQVTAGDPFYWYTFDKIDQLPNILSKKTTVAPTEIFNAATYMVARHYKMFANRNVDWQGFLQASRSQLSNHTSEEELFHLLKNLITNIADDHVSLTAKIGGRKFYVNPGEGETLRAYARVSKQEHLTSSDWLENLQDDIWTKEYATHVLGASYQKKAGSVRYGLIDGDIGFISLLTLEEFADSEEKDVKAINKILDRAIEAFQGARAVIIDISLNEGGYDSVSRAIAERFAPKRVLAYSKYAADDETAKPQAFFVEPSKRAQFLGPVYLLTSDVTVSAAEILTLCLRALPNVVHVGQETRGCLSDALWKRLPNSWSLSLSNEIYLDSVGKHWEGAGIPPQISFDVFSANHPQKSLYRAFLRIIDEIKARDSAIS